LVLYADPLSLLQSTYNYINEVLLFQN